MISHTNSFYVQKHKKGFFSFSCNTEKTDIQKKINQKKYFLNYVRLVLQEAPVDCICHHFSSHNIVLIVFCVFAIFSN